MFTFSSIHFICLIKYVLTLSFAKIFGHFFPFFSKRIPPQYWALFFAFFLTFLNKNYAQYPGAQNVGDTTKVQILNAQFGEFILYQNETARKLKGKVKLQHKDAIMYCDSAILDVFDNVLARGNVAIKQGDSVEIFADDSVRYFSASRTSDLFGAVALKSGTKKLFTEQLNYDFNTKIAIYNTKGTLTDERTQLTSRRGQFFLQQNLAFFKDQVLVVDKDFDLKTDTLRFDTQKNIAYFLAPTLIYLRDTAQFYTEGGEYDLTNEKAIFTQTPQYRKQDKTAVGDTMRYDGAIKLVTLIGNAVVKDSINFAQANTIRYNRETEESQLEGKAFFRDSTQNVAADTIFYNGKQKTYATRGRSDIQNGSQKLLANFVDFKDSVGIAIGDVFWRDTTNKTTIRCDSMRYDQRKDYIKATGGRPILTILVDADTLWLRADTIVSFKENPTDTLKKLLAFRKVRMFKSDFQSVCDSLSFAEQDSIFRLFYNPIIWSDTSQMTGDTMRILLKNKKIDQVFIKDNGLIVNTTDSLYYNQIKGRNITAFFEGDNIRRMLTEGNAESIYYALDDDKAYINANKVECSEMLILFGDNAVDKIKFYTQPKAKALPMQQTDHTAIRLKGFRWEPQLQPKGLKDL